MTRDDAPELRAPLPGPKFAVEAARLRHERFMARSGPEEAEAMMLDSYRARITPIDPSMRDKIHELTVSVFWPHRPHDLDLFLQLGRGYIALDEIGRPLGSAMYFPAGDDFAMCGIMVTTPRLQSQGAGRRLLRRIMRDCAGRDLRMSATRAGARLYHDAGFEPVSTIFQHQGKARPIHAPAPVPGVTLRELSPGDADAIRTLDRHAYGADRREVVDALLALSDGLVAERDGQVCAYALRRPFGKGVVIGPLVAENEAMAMQLAAPLIQRSEGVFTRLDLPFDSPRFGSLLAAAGMGVFDTVTEMALGRPRRADEGPQLYGLASHSLG